MCWALPAPLPERFSSRSSSQLSPILTARFGIALLGTGPGMVDLVTIAAVTVLSVLLGLGPALIALRRSLADGLTVKI